MDEEIQALRKELDATKGSMAGLMIAVTALIQTHQNHRLMNMALSESIDRQKGGGALWKALSQPQKDAAEIICSNLQKIVGLNLEKDPASSKRPPASA